MRVTDGGAFAGACVTLPEGPTGGGIAGGFPYTTNVFSQVTVWLLPTPEFRRAAFDNRGPLWDIAHKASNPQTALHNLLARDPMFTGHLYEETNRLELCAIRVDTTMTEDDLAERVTEAFGL